MSSLSLRGWKRSERGLGSDKGMPVGAAISELGKLSFKDTQTCCRLFPGVERDAGAPKGKRQPLPPHLSLPACRPHIQALGTHPGQGAQPPLQEVKL